MGKRRHVVLLGDSTLDNRAYVPAGEHVGLRLSTLGHRVLDYSRDGARLAEIAAQALAVRSGLNAVAADIADDIDVVLSVGGNDALAAAGVLAKPTDNVAAALHELRPWVNTFRFAYGLAVNAVLDQLREIGRLVLCTIYRPPSVGVPARFAVGLFNDAIARVAHAARRRHPDLVLVQLGDELDDADYLGIEPGPTASAKIAQALHHALGERR